MALRISNLVMAALFAFAVIVQYNDPDPLQWMAIYGAALVVCLWALRRPATYPRWAAVVVAVVALAWAASLAPHALGRVSPLRMFDHWEMKNTAVEENRESFGLLLVAAWMLVLALLPRRRPTTG